MLSRSQLQASNLPYRDWTGGLTISAISAAIAGVVGFKTMQSAGVYTDSPALHLKLLLEATAGFESGKEYLKWLAQQPFRSLLYYSMPTAAALGAGWMAWTHFGRLRDPIQHLAGGRLLRGNDAAKAARKISSVEFRASGPGLRFHPKLQFARHQELTSFLFLAGQRGGKTQILSRLLEQAWSRGDKTIAFDFKTDFTEITPPTSGGKSPILFAPWDKRTAVWDIAKDVRGVQHARAFAKGIIAGNDKDPMWSNAARALLVAIFMKLIAEHGTDWGWEELGRDAYLPIADLKQIAEKYYKPAIAIVADAESKTTQSVMINLHAFLTPLYDLRTMWGSLPKNRRLSFSNWLRNDETAYRNIVIQGSTEHHELAQAYIKSIIETCVSILASPSFPQSRERRIWWVMDEFVQFGKLVSIQTIPEVLASRGCSLIVAIQSIDQIEKVYGREIKAIFGNIFQTKIFGRITGASDAEWVQREAGKRKVSRLNRTVSGQGKGQVNLSQSFIEEEVEVIRKEDLAKLGLISDTKKPNGKFIRALVLGHGIDALEFEWPLWQHMKYRKTHIPADEHIKSANPPSTMPAVQISHGNAELQRTQLMPSTRSEQIVSIPAIKETETLQQEILSILDSGISEAQKLASHAYTLDAEGHMRELASDVSSDAVIHALSDATGINESLAHVIQELDQESNTVLLDGTPKEFVGIKQRKKKARTYVYQDS